MDYKTNLDLKRVVYTAITAGKDILVEEQNTEGADFVAYMDAITNPSRMAKTDSWYIRQLRATPNAVREDYARQAKLYKMLPHVFFPNAEYSLWMDGNMRLLVPLGTLIDKYLREHDIAFFKHPIRDCIYDEGDVCRQLVLDDVFIMELQMKRYREQGYPEHNGLIDGSVILRRHTKKIKELNTLWYKEITRYSKRDQLSFDYLAWKLGIKYQIMEGFNHAGTNEYIESIPHLRERN